MQALGSYVAAGCSFSDSAPVWARRSSSTACSSRWSSPTLPYKKGGREDYAGLRGLERCGKKRWRKHVADIIVTLQAALEVDDVVVGGGNAKLLKTLPRGVRLGSNEHAFSGGFRLWDTPHATGRRYV